MTQPGSPLAVTFDCWNTLLYERTPEVARGVRAERLRSAVGAHGREVDSAEARAAIEAGFQRHNELWLGGVGSGAREITVWALESIGVVPERELVEPLATELAEVSLGQSVHALEGARACLDRLAATGVRIALVCDTGFSPGRVVRQLLDRAGLLERLEVQVFSDEVGVPKPHANAFRAALEPLGVDARDAIHVGDLRRTDVAGARAVGMGTVRIRHRYDDRSEHPEADAVADSHVHLREILGVD